MSEEQKGKFLVKKVAIQKEGYLAIFYEFHQVCTSFFKLHQIRLMINYFGFV